MVRQFSFTPFNGGNPLLLAQNDDIPVAALKGLPYFNGEDQTMFGAQYNKREHGYNIVGCFVEGETPLVV